MICSIDILHSVMRVSTQILNSYKMIKIKILFYFYTVGTYTELFTLLFFNSYTVFDTKHETNKSYSYQNTHVI